MSSGLGIRIRIQYVDPDPGVNKFEEKTGKMQGKLGFYLSKFGSARCFFLRLRNLFSLLQLQKTLHTYLLLELLASNL